MKLIVFDCDGTIVDSQHAIVAAMDRAFAEHGLVPRPRSDVLGVVGLSLGEAISNLVDEPQPARIAMLCESYKLALADLRRNPGHHEPLFPNARKVLTQLAARPDVLLGIATGKSRRGVDALFEREGIGSLFVTIQTADDHPSKPHPSMLHRAMSEAGAEPEATLMIGDTTYDMDMARAAGVGAIGVTWGYHPAEALSACGLDALVDAYAVLPAAIDAHYAAGEVAA